MPENRNYKSDVFSMLLENPVYALEVYNALNGTDYQNPSEVTMKRLEQGISLSIRNDAAFVIDFHINIYEHQSTYNPNMPLRSLIYYADIVRPVVKDRDLYSRKRIPIDTPHFVVFYNGKEERPEKEILRLSDSFSLPTDTPELELICTVYNINKGKNQNLLQKCKVLREYMYFVDEVRKNIASGMELEQAIPDAIEECIRQHVLEEFLRSRKMEVMKAMTLDYTWERREELIRKEEWEDGRLEGRKEGISQGISRGTSYKLIELVCKKLRRHKSVSEIAEDLEEDEGFIQKMCEVAEKYAPEYDVDKVMEEWFKDK
jgi:hypothetical protein